MSTTDDTAPTPVPKRGGGDPSALGGLAGLIAAAVLFFGARLALPVDQETADLVGGAAAVVLGPVVSALVTRLKAWKPDTVAKLREELLSLVREQAIASGAPPVRSVGAKSPADDTPTEAIGTEDGQPGRHIRYQNKGDGK
jgi:hypothetical protein